MTSADPYRTDPSPGWEARLRQTAFARVMKRPAVAGAVLAGLCPALWLLMFPPMTPIRKFNLLSDLIADFFGPRSYETYLRTVAVPAGFGMIFIAPIFWMMIVRFEGHRIHRNFRTLDELYFYPSHVEVLASGQVHSYPINVKSSGNAEDSVSQKWRRRQASGFLDSKLILPWGIDDFRVWRVENAKGARIWNATKFILPRLQRCRSFSSEIPRSRLSWTSIRSLLLLFAGVLAFIAEIGLMISATTLLLIPTLRLSSLIELQHSAEIWRLADAHPFYRAAMLSEAVDRSATIQEYDDMARQYFEAGGESKGIRAGEAIVQLGRGRPRIGRAMLSPERELSWLQSKLDEAAGDLERARRELRRCTSTEAGACDRLMAAFDYRCGRLEEARFRLLRDHGSTPQGRLGRAVLWNALGDRERSLEILHDPALRRWMDETGGTIGRERPPRTPIDAHTKLGRCAKVAIAWRILGDPRADDLWKSTNELAQKTGLPHLLDPYLSLRLAARK